MLIIATESDRRGRIRREVEEFRDVMVIGREPAFGLLHQIGCDLSLKIWFFSASGLSDKCLGVIVRVAIIHKYGIKQQFYGEIDINSAKVGARGSLNV
jgi:hypothetical protein